LKPLPFRLGRWRLEGIGRLSTSSTLPTVPPAPEVVIIGGGVMGASIAFHLAEAGVSNIVVVERGELGSGSSGKPIGGLRAQFSDPRSTSN